MAEDRSQTSPYNPSFKRTQGRGLLCCAKAVSPLRRSIKASILEQTIFVISEITPATAISS
jgi:hypothetical protein